MIDNIYLVGYLGIRIPHIFKFMKILYYIIVISMILFPCIYLYFKQCLHCMFTNYHSNTIKVCCIGTTSIRST